MTRERYIVDVRDDVDARIAGHDGVTYTSPPQARRQALELIAVLLGGPVDPGTGHSTWTQPIPGGRRVIRLEHGQPND